MMMNDRGNRISLDNERREPQTTSTSFGQVILFLSNFLFVFSTATDTPHSQTLDSLSISNRILLIYY